ncbi:hypothetical protein KUTeg_023507 [Tegillarca granosa]|uniref:MARVEL domain-containing protein n=1 Tax=Tegillarca granosa TaxID=220873 RepID=A0ABQ9E6E7_TEGGR|nr:hypothetical protein KUTeg_023507 [Tegillarca granosa]
MCFRGLEYLPVFLVLVSVATFFVTYIIAISKNDETLVEPVHITGAALVFGFGVVYAFLQTWLSYHMFPDYNGIYICRIRLGFNAHIISTFGEWITAVTFLCFFFTYIRDFQKVKVEIRARLSVRHLDEAPLLLPNESTRLLA